MAIIQLQDVTKSYGAFDALRGVNLEIDQGEVLCVLGDNGAGKSTLIKILSGLHQPTSGQMLLDGTPTTFSSPRDAINHGIATVYQNLAIVDSLSVWRNFFLGNEISGMLGTLKQDEMRARCDDALREMGINIPDVDVEAGNLSGGQRQVLAIARAIHFGARVVILDEPTAALGVKQSGVVLRFVAAARDRGVAVVLVTHNPHHAYLVGDRFTILKLGRQEINAERADITLEELTAQMAGGEELAALSHELER
ncbi:ATP-binding cassette domain-containing protein [Corynebacterium sanguinis]|uniref:ATP-binding cassette domain-containing protein n=1 Tax=Corynebacterium sanguinis TaxID=2594913 RepID=UPI0021AF2AF8|nr:ATP-binding cassette domain-containing protein [Corynebacterium sanguinis]MCT1411110.1 ATP-binding cassette domain-containing protein [Corynebacterium sanguinis]MCT1444005.1 ATP-binding cassette domain-containing protein [Corynebacterium sanguinis]MCT1492249.1 ATP-binding cassette domain-containing protein [Corynebacterium sanguinis]MCT1596628.1 ATP-binding cassette domain-containing protein [Corynebacterium sanguinis]MCT2247186.1 ATP-binding cassette domain-containing protein [Corynebacter